MIQFSTRNLFLLIASIASLVLIVKPASSLPVFIVSMTMACTLWAVLGLSMHNEKCPGKYLALLCLIPLMVGLSAMNVAVGDGWHDVRIQPSLPQKVDASMATLYATLHRTK